MKTIRDLLSPEELELYRTIVKPFNIRVLRKALDKKLELDPDYEVFVPFQYYRYKPVVKKDEGLFISSDEYLVSNKGNVLFKRGARTLRKPQVMDNGYISIKVHVLGKLMRVQSHRLIASLFVFPKPELESIDLSILQVNHCNGIKADWSLSNLEWSTGSENVVHGRRTGLYPDGKQNHRTKPIKGKVLSGENAGYEFILFGVNDCIESGFNRSNVAACIAGRIKYHKNCVFTFATEDEIQILPRGGR